VSDCFQELKPGDHIEIQWRGNTRVPYGRFILSSQILTLINI
jgi:hypothetical protein